MIISSIVTVCVCVFVHAFGSSPKLVIFAFLFVCLLITVFFLRLALNGFIIIFVCRTVPVRYHATMKQQLYIRFSILNLWLCLYFPLDVYVFYVAFLRRKNLERSIKVTCERTSP